MPMLLVLNLLSLLVFVVQFFTGFFIEPEAQIVILSLGNVIFRSFVGRDLFHGGAIRAAVLQRYDITTKTIWASKVFWISFCSVLGALIQWRLGWVVDPKYYLVIISTVVSIVAAVTKKPVSLK